MESKSSRGRSPKNESEGPESDSSAPRSSAATDRESTDERRIEANTRPVANARGTGVPIQRSATAERVPGQLEAGDTERGYVDYDPGPTGQAIGDRYGIDVPGGRAGELQRLETEFGSDRVSRWVAEGMTVETMGKPRDMEAFRTRQSSRAEQVPTDVERRNAASLQRNADANPDDAPAGDVGVPEVVRSVVSSPGTSMDESVQRDMESSLGGDFSDVQLHTDLRAAAAAESIDARAFTVGNHVVFNSGEYRPESDDGKRILAHELTHVRQQTDGRLSLLPEADAPLAVDPDPALEREAEQAARRFPLGEPRSTMCRTTEMTVQRQPDEPGGGSQLEPHHSLEDLPDPIGDEEAKQWVIDALERQGLSPPEGMTWDDFLTVEGEDRGEGGGESGDDGGRETTPEGWTIPESDEPATGLRKTVRVGLTADGTPVTSAEWTEQIAQLATQPEGAVRDDLIPRFLTVTITRFEGVLRGGEPTGPGHVVNVRVVKAAPEAIYVERATDVDVVEGVTDLSPAIEGGIGQVTDEDFALGQPKSDAFEDPTPPEGAEERGETDAGQEGADQSAAEKPESPTAEEPGSPTAEKPGSSTADAKAGSSDDEVYTIQEGDTLWDIAREHGVEGGWRRLWKYADNETVIGDDPDLIFPGDEIKIPADSAATDAGGGSPLPERPTDEQSAQPESPTDGSSEQPAADGTSQRESWTNPTPRGGGTTWPYDGTKVGAIYFPTDVSSLDAQDREVLDRLLYAIDSRLLEREFDLEFVGYADKRGPEGYNVGLSADRARAVADFFSPLTQLPYGSENYSSEVTPLGEYTVEQTGTTAEELARFRRVDIVVRPPIGSIDREEPEPPEPQGEPTSVSWKARLQGSAAGGVGVGIAVTGLEIVDETNGRRMYYAFGGAGASAGTPTASETSDWDHFETSRAITITDFEGDASHAGASAGLGDWTGSIGVETLLLSGPESAGASPVRLTWAGLGEGWGIGAGAEVGELVPLTDPESIETGPPDLDIPDR